MNLTPRELESVQLAADGLRAREIAELRGISRTSVKRLWWQAEQKLGADNIAHAVAQALRYKLIT